MDDLELNVEWINIPDIIHKYIRSITTLAFTYTKNVSDAEDIAQEVFVELLSKNIQFESEEHLKAWLIRVTINKSKNLVKSFWYKKRSDFPEEYGYIPEHDVDLIRAVLTLDKKYRTPIHLFYYEGYSIQEIADIMNEKISTIGTRLERGRNKIKEILGNDYFG